MRKFAAFGAFALTIAFAGTSFGAGSDVYKRTCLPCHGNEGAGTALAPAFKENAWLKDAPVDDVATTITEGRSGAAKKYDQFVIDMPPQPLSPDEVKEVIEYIKGLAAEKTE